MSMENKTELTELEQAVKRAERAELMVEELRDECKKQSEYCDLFLERCCRLLSIFGTEEEAKELDEAIKKMQKDSEECEKANEDFDKFKEDEEYEIARRQLEELEKQENPDEERIGILELKLITKEMKAALIGYRAYSHAKASFDRVNELSQKIFDRIIADNSDNAE